MVLKIILYALAALLLVLIVLLLIPLRAYISYSDSGFELTVKYLFFKIFDINDSDEKSDKDDSDSDTSDDVEDDQTPPKISISDIEQSSAQNEPDDGGIKEPDDAALSDDSEFQEASSSEPDSESPNSDSFGSSLKKPFSGKHKFKRARIKAKDDAEKKPPLSDKINGYKEQWDEIKVFIPTAKKAFKKLLKLIKIRKLEFSITVGGDDPYSAAMNFAKVNQAVYPALGLLCCLFSVTIKSTDIICDYDRKVFDGSASLVVRATPMAILSLLIFVLINYLKIRNIQKKNERRISK